MKRIIALIILFVLMYSFQNVGVAENFPVKEKFLILVNEDKEKDAYADFVYFKSARYDVDIFSMNDIGPKFHPIIRHNFFNPLQIQPFNLY